MKIIHIESGLGNQMLSYCEYLAIKKANPTDDCYIENIIFDIKECNEVIKQWNGYELDQIFNINAPNIRELFTSQQWEKCSQTSGRPVFGIKNGITPSIFQRFLRSMD